MRPVPGARPITITFNADTSDNMPWRFTPQQDFVRVVPGETALIFYRAYNPSSKPVTGVSTYNVTPMRAGIHFNKIQCFCFEEQRLRPHEEIDMPVSERGAPARGLPIELLSSPNISSASILSP